MTGFEFGTEEELSDKLHDVLESDAYHRAVEAWERKRDIAAGRYSTSATSAVMANGQGGQSPSSSSVGLEQAAHGTTTKQRSKLFQNLFSPSSSPPGTPTCTGGLFESSG